MKKLRTLEVSNQIATYEKLKYVMETHYDAEILTFIRKDISVIDSIPMSNFIGEILYVYYQNGLTEEFRKVRELGFKKRGKFIDGWVLQYFVLHNDPINLIEDSWSQRSVGLTTTLLPLILNANDMIKEFFFNDDKFWKQVEKLLIDVTYFVFIEDSMTDEFKNKKKFLDLIFKHYQENPKLKQFLPDEMNDLFIFG